jgi:hypothetical protein
MYIGCLYLSISLPVFLCGQLFQHKEVGCVVVGGMRACGRGVSFVGSCSPGEASTLKALKIKSLQAKSFYYKKVSTRHQQKNQQTGGYAGMHSGGFRKVEAARAKGDCLFRRFLIRLNLAVSAGAALWCLRAPNSSMNRRAAGLNLAGCSSFWLPFPAVRTGTHCAKTAI